MLSKFIASFHDSETIWWSRIKTAVGTILLAVLNSGADLSVWLSPRWFVVWQIAAAWLMFDGGLSEYARRRRTDDDLNPLPPKDE